MRTDLDRNVIFFFCLINYLFIYLLGKDLIRVIKKTIT